MSKDMKLFADGSDNDCVEGLALLAQRFLLELLTERGSMYYLPKRGCDFIARLRKAKTEFDIIVAFAAARAQLKRNLRNDEKELPLDACYKSASVGQMSISNSEIVLEFVVRSRSNETITITTPVLKLKNHD